MFKKSIITLSLLVASSSVQAGPILAAIGYWGVKGAAYLGMATTVAVTAPVAAPVLVAGGSAAATTAVVASTTGVAGAGVVAASAAAGTVATIETVSTGVWGFLLALPTP